MPRPRKPKPPEPKDDEIREHILRFLHERHKKARSAKGTRARISELKNALKSLGVRQNRIVTNLIYLVQAGWVEEDSQTYIIQRGNRPIQVTSVDYRISNRGIDRFEGPSRFQETDHLKGINITNVQGVTVIGEGNIVDAQFEMLSRNLDLLAAEVRASDRLDDRQKLSSQADIDTIKSHLMKPEPDRGIVGKAWESLRSALKAIATVSGVATAIDRVRPYIEGLLH